MLDAKNIFCGIITNAIYDIVKYVSCALAPNDKTKQTESLKTKISKAIEPKIPEEFISLYESGTLNVFFNSPQFSDAINSYLIYKIIGRKNEKAIEITQDKKQGKTDSVLTIENLIEHLTTNIIKLYHENNTLTVPNQVTLRSFIEFIINSSHEFIINELSNEEKSAIYFINSRIDIIMDNVERALFNLQENLQHMTKNGVAKTTEDYEKIKKEYYNILKTKNSEAHIYLLDKFDFNKFYVPPVLAKNSRELPRFMFEMANPFTGEIYETWRYIFAQRNIIYITGGAGYGKSLFMKKLINDYAKLNLFHSEEYLVIYGELKMFFPNNSDSPISVKQFLQNSMKTSTLMDEEKLTYDFIDYYLSIGRCIILLDALDEVEKTKRNELHETVISFFKNQNPNNKICITSRNRGFIPEKDIEVFNICPLSNIQIEAYVDKIIKLKKFERADKEAFMKQTSVLVDKGFLNSFLVLSLLINIYKAERELPENKLELYQKCFEYIANKREKDKTQTRYNWEIISPIMKENTFIELAEMCYPNNADVDKSAIKDKLISTYKSKYGNEVDTENAIEEFLKFCSDRTELFVPATGEDKFKFFHRSFFEFFYSQYIFYRCHNTDEILSKLLQFDIDSEVFELTIAMLKQKSENKYQDLIELMIEKARQEFLESHPTFSVFNILILSMQVVDDILYQNEFLKLILENRLKIIKYRDKLHNTSVITEIFADDDASKEKISSIYYNNSLIALIDKMTSLLDIWDSIISKENLPTDIDFQHMYFKSFRRRLPIYRRNNWHEFYVDIFTKTYDIQAILCTLSKDNLEKIYRDCYGKRKISRILKQAEENIAKFQAFDQTQKESFCNRLIDL